MARVWKECIAPKYMHDNFGVYHGIWMPQMDRCWFSDDGYQVTSRILITEWGKVEHAAITRNGDEENYLSFNGERDIRFHLVFILQKISSVMWSIEAVRRIQQC